MNTISPDRVIRPAIGGKEAPWGLGCRRYRQRIPGSAGSWQPTGGKPSRELPVGITWACERDARFYGRRDDFDAWRRDGFFVLQKGHLIIAQHFQCWVWVENGEISPARDGRRRFRSSWRDLIAK